MINIYPKVVVNILENLELLELVGMESLFIDGLLGSDKEVKGMQEEFYRI